MANYDDDEDWTGTPPEGHYTRDRAKPDFWLTQRPVEFAALAVGIIVIAVVVILLLS